MTIYDLIIQRAQIIIWAADYTTTPPTSPNLNIIRERYALDVSIDDIESMIWAESEKIADDVIYGDLSN